MNFATMFLLSIIMIVVAVNAQKDDDEYVPRPNVFDLKYNILLKLTNGLDKDTGGFSAELDFSYIMESNSSTIEMNGVNLLLLSCNHYCLGKRQGILGKRDNCTFTTKPNGLLEIDLGKVIQKGSQCKMKIEYAASYDRNVGLSKSTTFSLRPDQGFHFDGIFTRNKANFVRHWVPCIDEPNALAVWNIEVYHENGHKLLAPNQISIRNMTGYQISKMTLGENPRIIPQNVIFGLISMARYSYLPINIDTALKMRMTLHIPTALSKLIRINDLSVEITVVISEFASFFGYLPNYNPDIVLNWESTNTEGGSAYDKLIMLDFSSRLDSFHIRRILASWWLGSNITYPTYQDSWFLESLSYHLARYPQSLSPEMKTIKRLNSLNEVMRGAELETNSLSQDYDLYYEVLLTFRMCRHKGAHIFVMIEEIMQERFRTDLKSLFNKFMNKRPKANDLIMELNRIDMGHRRAPKNYFTFLEPFVSRVGIPTIYMTFTNGRYHHYVKLYQVPYSSRGNDSISPMTNNRWTIPIYYMSGNRTGVSWFDHDHDNDTMLLKKENPQEHEDYLLQQEDNVLIDPLGYGLYAVQYENQLYLKMMFEIYNRNCTLFHRYCMGGMNEGFCNKYDMDCTFPPWPEPESYAIRNKTEPALQN